MSSMYRWVMSASPSPDLERAIEHCQPTDVTPVTVDEAALESTAPEYLRDLKGELTDEGLFAAALSLTVSFDEDCSLHAQDTAERVREFVRAAAFLGAGRVVVDVDHVENPAKARPALEACRERARREGVDLEVDGAVTLAA